MKITIIRSDGIIGLDGVFCPLDVSDMPSEIHALQFDTATRKGHIEFNPDLKPRPENLHIEDVDAFQKFIDRWVAPAPEPAPAAAEIVIKAKVAPVSGVEEF